LTALAALGAVPLGAVAQAKTHRIGYMGSIEWSGEAIR
jgi:hypothetical protein